MLCTSRQENRSLWMPEIIARRYNHTGFGSSWYARLRWRLCPIATIASFLPKNGKILDLGAGAGLLAHYLAQANGGEVVGIDLDPKRILTAQRSSLPGESTRFICNNFLESPWPPCDAIVTVDTLHHLNPSDQERVIQRSFHHLKTGGRLVILEVSLHPLWKYLFWASVDQLLNLRDKLYVRTEDQWKALLKKIGFRVTVYRADGNLPLPDVIFSCQKP